MSFVSATAGGTRSAPSPDTNRWTGDGFGFSNCGRFRVVDFSRTGTARPGTGCGWSFGFGRSDGGCRSGVTIIDCNKHTQHTPQNEDTPHTRQSE
jgi:hypothetical protein